MIGSKSAARGGTVTIPIDVSNNGSGFAAVGLVVSYEADKLTLDSIVPVFQNELPARFTISSERVGDRIFQWILFANEGDMTQSFDRNDVAIANLNFTVSPSATTGSSLINMGWTPAPREGRPVGLDSEWITGAQVFGGSVNITAGGAQRSVTVVNGSGGGNFAVGALVSITANAPPAGQQFKSWTVTPSVTFTNGTSETSRNAVFTMPASDVTATATFEPIPAGNHAVTVTHTGSGVANANVQSAAPNATITLTATPNAGNKFVRWEVVTGTITLSSTTTTTATFTMPSHAVSVRAVFEPDGTPLPPVPPPGYYRVTIQGGGTGSSPSGDYLPGDTVSINAGSTPTGSTGFNNWTANPTVAFANASSVTTTFVMPSSNVTVTANWTGSGTLPPTPPPGHFRVTVQGGGTGSTPTADYLPGATVSLNAGATPTGSTGFNNWTANPTVAFANASSVTTTFVMPSSNVTVTANWTGGGDGGTLPPTPPPGHFRVTVQGGGTGSTPTGDYLPGATVSINAGATPSGSTGFNNWTASPTVAFANASNVTTTFVMPSNNLTVTANWTGGSGGGGGGGGGGGDASTIPVLSHFGTWSGSGTATARIDGDHTKFVRLLLHGNVVATTNYTTAAGSTIVTLNESYLRSFANGTYNFRAEFTEGFSNLTLIVSHNFGNVPQTGISDMTGTIITMWLSIAMTAVLGFCLYTYIKANRKHRKFGSDHED